MALIRVDTAGDYRVDLTSSISATGAWTDLDLSAHIGSDATGVYLLIYSDGTPTGHHALDFRKNGSTDGTDSAGWHTREALVECAFCGVDASGILEYYQASALPSGVEVYLAGYCNDSAVFPANKSVYTLSATNTWEDVDITSIVGADAGNLLGVFIESRYTFNGNQGLRKNGSTDDADVWSNRGARNSGLVGVDASDIFEARTHNTGRGFLVVGWVTDEAVFDTNVTVAAGTADGTWHDNDYTWNTAYPFGFILFDDNTNDFGGFRPKGTSWTETGEIHGHAGGPFAAPLDAGQYQHNVVSTYNSLFRFGHSSAVASSGVDVQVPLKTFTQTEYVPIIGIGANVFVPKKDFTITAFAPIIGIGVNIFVPVKAFVVSPHVPDVITPINVLVPLHQFTITPHTPMVGMVISVPHYGFTITPHVPAVGVGTNIVIPLKTFSQANHVPSVAIVSDVVVPLYSYSFNKFVPSVKALAPAIRTAKDLDLTPPFNPEQAKYLHENFTTIKDLLDSEQTIEFTTQEGWKVLVRNGVIINVIQ